MIKKYILGMLVALTIPAMVAYAATPTLSVSGTGNGNVSVNVSHGEIHAPVVLYYNSANLGTIQGYSLGSTNASGTFSGTFNTNVIGINGSFPVNVQVGGYQSNTVMWPYTATSTGNNNMNLSFSNVTPSMNIGQSGTVTISGGSGTYFIANNSNPGVITPSINGNTLSLHGSAAGSGTITVCSTGGGCGTLTASFIGTSSPTLSTNNLNVLTGGQGSLTLSGGMSPYTVQVLSGTGVSTTLIGNTLFVNGHATGTTNLLNICSANNGGCTQLAVNVQAQPTSNNNGNATSSNGGPFNNNAGQFNFTVPISVGQNMTIHLGGTGTWFLQSPVFSPIMASINGGNTLVVNGSSIGTGTVNVCQTGGACFPVRFLVNPSVHASSNTNLTGTGGGYLFETNLFRGLRSEAVAELQARLKEMGYFNSNVTGYFGGATMAAVKRFQRDNNIPATGYVGTQTRAILNN